MHKKNTIKLAVFTLLVGLSSNAFSSSFALAEKPLVRDHKCIKQRVLFDVGSTSTKASLATLDLCKGSIITIDKSVTYKMPYQKHLELAKDKGLLSQEVQDAGLAIFKEIKEEIGVDCKQVECSAVVTASIDQAANKQMFIDMVYAKENIAMHLLAAEEEARLSYKSALLTYPHDPKNKSNILVLNIGSSRTKVSATDQKGGFHAVNGGVGSENFKTMLIELVKNYYPYETDTPNPMTEREVELSTLLSSKTIGEVITTDPYLSVLSRYPDVKVVGIGSLIKNGLLPILNPGATYFSIMQVNEVLKKMTLKSDEYIKAAFPDVIASPSTIVSNLIIIKGVMDSLGVKQVEVIRTADNDSALLMSEYWEN